MKLLRIIGALVLLTSLVVVAAVAIGFVHWAFWYGTWIPLLALDTTAVLTYFGLTIVILFPLSWRGLALGYATILLSIMMVALLRLLYFG